MHGYEAIADGLIKEHVREIFAVSGEDNMLLLAHLMEGDTIRVISARKESGATAMADGYSRVSGRPGVCAVSTGPGLANTATALVAARRHRSPVICITTEPPVFERHHLKAWDQRRFAEATAGQYVRVRHPETLAADLQLAFRVILSGEGPVVLAVPHEIMMGELAMEWEYVPANRLALIQRIEPDAEAIAKAVDILRTAERPIILAGRGAWESQAGEELKGLAKRTGALLATTLLAKGYLADHPHNIGTAGGYATDLAHSLLSESDCLLVAGSSLNRRVTESGLLFAEARIIQIDCNPTNIGKITPVSLGIVGDVRATIAALSSELDRQGCVPSRGWDDAEQRITAARAQPAQTQFIADLDTIDPGELVTRMDELLPKERVIVTDSGHSSMFLDTCVSVAHPSHFVRTGDFGSVGLGLYQGVGAAVGRPDIPVIAFVGDGGLMMSIEELDTAVREQIPVTVVVMNDNAFGAEIHMLRAAGKPVDVALYDNPDFAQVARALGALGQTVRNSRDLETVVGMVGKTDRPLLVDAKVNPNVCQEMASRSMAVFVSFVLQG